MHFYIYPGWLVVAMYGAVVAHAGIRSNSFMPFTLCATILLFVSSVIMFVQKKKYSKLPPPLHLNIPASLIFVSGVSLLLSHFLISRNGELLLLGCCLVFFAGLFLVVNTLVNWPRE